MEKSNPTKEEMTKFKYIKEKIKKLHCKIGNILLSPEHLPAYAIYAFLLFLFIYILNFYSSPFSKNSADWGTFGDFMGGLLNPTLSFFALLALLKTTKIQSNEILNNRKMLTFQQFENNVFQQMGLLQNIIEDIHLEGNYSYKINGIKKNFSFDEAIEGRRAVMKLHALFDKTLFEVRHDHKGNVGKYEDFYESFLHSILGHYFRSIYRLISYVDKQDKNIISEEQKIYYIHNIRAQLSSSELYFIFYSSLSKWGENFKPLIEKYSLFEHLHPKGVIATNLILYKLDAFGENEEICSKYTKQQENHKKRQTN